jgi:trans-aconitate methyltransferase
MAPDFPEAGIDFEKANAARMYDYWLGGGHNFAVDREQAARVEAGNPAMVHAARSNRAFLGRVIRWAVAQGIDQFLDLGSGVPTVGNVHEIAHRLDPDARVAYVDFETVAVTHARSILAPIDHVTITAADLREPDTVLGAPGVAGLLDFDRPVAVLAVAVLHFVEGDLGAVLARYRERLVPGSALAVNHVSDDQDDPDLAARVRAGADAYRGSATPLTTRSRADLAAVLTGLEIVPPGMVDVTDWPTPQPGVAPIGVHAAVARVP